LGRWRSGPRAPRRGGLDPALSRAKAGAAAAEAVYTAAAAVGSYAMARRHPKDGEEAKLPARVRVCNLVGTRARAPAYTEDDGAGAAVVPAKTTTVQAPRQRRRPTSPPTLAVPVAAAARRLVRRPLMWQ